MKLKMANKRFCRSAYELPIFQKLKPTRRPTVMCRATLLMMYSVSLHSWTQARSTTIFICSENVAAYS